MLPTTDPTDGPCLHHLVEAQARRTPEAVAVVTEAEEITYRELNRRANRLARRLQALGVGPEARVGIQVERSVETMVGLLGTLKAGGAYLPLDPSYPRERVAFMLADAGVRVVLTQRRLLESLPTHQGEVICLDTDGEVLGHESQADPTTTVTAEHPAYVIYTSGSTGKPKGVQISHRAVVDRLLALRDRPQLTDRDTVLAVVNLAFDMSVLEIFSPLMVGARLVLASREVTVDGARLMEGLARSNATFVIATPTTWRLLLDAGWDGNPSLTMASGGEALTTKLAAQLTARGASLWNLYGPTETTIFCSSAQIAAGDEVISIGRSIVDTRLYILDPRLESVPSGSVGELHIGGAGLARGYLRRPGLTAEKFVPDPYSGEPGARMYKSGDLARYRPDGTIECLGRVDHQIKLRGFRIEPGEIEAALARHPGVREAAVVMKEETSGDKRLVAYFVLRQERAPSIGELRGLLRARLPEHMVPAAFVPLGALPLTPNGKLDRGALPAPEGARPELDNGFVAPRSPVEVRLAEIWTRLLGIESLGVHDNFFALGGHSLSATRVVTRLRTVFQVELPLRTIFERPTIAGLAQALTQRLESPPGSRLTQPRSIPRIPRG